MSGTVLGADYILNHLTLTAALGDGGFYYLQLTDDTEAQQIMGP